MIDLSNMFLIVKRGGGWDLVEFVLLRELRKVRHFRMSSVD